MPISCRSSRRWSSSQNSPSASRPASTPEKLAHLTHVSRAFDELLNRSPNAQAPYVGKSAFATKAGIHASAIVKEPETYEHVPPETVGNRRRMLVSDQAGKSNLLAELDRIGLAVDKDDTRLDALLREVKEREAQGYAYDGADASFELLARRTLGTVPHYFDVLSFRVIVEHRHNALGELVTVSEAVVKVKVDGEIFINAGEGNGPVNALDVALAQGSRQVSSASSTISNSPITRCVSSMAEREPPPGF